MDYKEKRKKIIEQKRNKELLEMDEAITGFLQSRKLKNLTENTHDFYFQTLSKFKEFLAENDVSRPIDVITEDVYEFIQRRLDIGNKASTVNKYIRGLRAFFNHLHSSGYLNENPMEPIDKLVEEKRINRTLSREQVVALLDAPDRGTIAGFRAYVFLLVLLDTGIRLEEALTFRVHDVYWQEQVIQIYGKGRTERVVPFSETLALRLREYQEMRGEQEHDIFFVNAEGQPLRRRYVQEQISDYGKLANIKGVRVSCHSLRYTFARNYLMNGGDIVSLMSIMGHKTLEMVKLYAEMYQPDISVQHTKYSPVNSILND
ncbi:tyrosine-type recombinase/integrase [Paenibacillus polymyxa]|uniref:tyrosine-type recombinase/integrase n=1 Tax=Paenibacillus polymyxa TaxID=1406 RepID=UPI0004705790|nr:tyrosine-type recombinase/integrase [Paenibacillus polymyxa]